MQTKGRHVNFALDPLRSHFDECQNKKNLQKKIIVEANIALLSPKKDSSIVKGSKRPEDGAALTPERPRCP